MGIPISTLFCDLGQCQKKLYDLIYNHYYFFILMSEDTYEMEVVEERLRFMMAMEMETNFEDSVWDDIWFGVLHRIRRENIDQYLYL